MPIPFDDAFLSDQSVFSPSRQRSGWFNQSECTQTLESCTQELSRPAEVSVKGMSEAQRSDQASGELLATVSHEFRTPLNGILGLAGLLLCRDLGPVEREFVEVIKESGETLLALVDDVLDFSKMEAGRLELETVEVDPRVIIGQAVRIVQVSADGKGLSIVTDVDGNVPAAIKGDPLRLRQILLNLLSNAVKFTPAGTITIRLELSVDAASNPVLCFTVTDTGIGISPEAQTRLFQPFCQADSSISRQFGGTGLGLAICRRLIERMGGAIGVRSELGSGSSFWFTLRAVTAKGKPGDPFGADEFLEMAQSGRS